MAIGKFLTLLDDIAVVLDDVAVMTKVAARKAAGVLGDDLALNAEQVTGVRADRELPVVWAVAKGSLVNKVILVPSALLISAFVPWMIQPLLMLGGAFLSFEGVEKVIEKLFHKKTPEEREERLQVVADESIDLVTYEQAKIKGAVRTDFILSAEIIVITLGTVAGAGFAQRVGVLVSIALLMNVLVYGLVAGIVKLDDLGLYLRKKQSAALSSLGYGIVVAAPWLMKTLGVVGTIAMFLVGGGIIAHGIPQIQQGIDQATQSAGPIAFAVPTLLNGVVGIITGAVVLALITPIIKLVKRARSTGAEAPPSA